MKPWGADVMTVECEMCPSGAIDWPYGATLCGCADESSMSASEGTASVGGRGISGRSVAATAETLGARYASLASNIRNGLRSAALGVVALIAVPAAASANCEVPLQRLDPFVEENGRLALTDRVTGNAYGS